jgi:DNA-binding transcriptional LysR family regulator
MRNLNLDQLRTLTEVIEQGSFSAAARRLNLTQPAVSLQVRELEKRFGVQLIERLGRQTKATIPGRAPVETAQRIFIECKNAEAVMRHFRDGWVGHVRVSTTNTALMYELPPILRKLHTDHPNIDLHVTNMPTAESLEQVIQNKIDLALVTLPVVNKHVRITPLRAQRLVAIFAAGTRHLPEVITPAFVAHQSLVIEHTRGAVYALVMRWLADHLPLARPPMHLGTVEALKAAVQSRLGMSIVPDIAVAQRGDLIVRPLQPAVPSILALIEHRNKTGGLALDIVRKALLELRASATAAAAPKRTTHKRKHATKTDRD